MDAVADPRRGLDAALRAAMRQATSSVMEWGRDDCARWCAGVLREALGYDASAPWGRYESREGAASALGPLGLGFALRAAANRHVWTRIAPADAAVGDIGLALLPDEDGTLHPTTMICRAPGWFVARSERGFTALDAKAVRLAWAVV